MARATKIDVADAHVDETLLRHVRLVKPHLAPTGFKSDKWATIVTAVNRDVGRRVWTSGNGPRSRYGHLLSQFNKNKRSLAAPLRQRLTDYLKLLYERSGQHEVKSREHEYVKEEDEEEVEEEEQDEEEVEDEVEEEYRPGDDDESEDETEDVPPPRSRRAPAPRAEPPILDDHAVGRPSISTVLDQTVVVSDTIAALRDMTSGLLQVIKDDHAMRQRDAQRIHDEHKELLEIVRLALQPRE